MSEQSNQVIIRARSADYKKSVELMSLVQQTEWHKEHKHVAVATPMVYSLIEEREEKKPFLTVSRAAAVELFQDLWDIGLRPKAWTESFPVRSVSPEPEPIAGMDILIEQMQDHIDSLKKTLFHPYE